MVYQKHTMHDLFHSREPQSNRQHKLKLCCWEKLSHLLQSSITAMGVGYYYKCYVMALQDKLVLSRILTASLLTPLAFTTFCWLAINCKEQGNRCIMFWRHGWMACKSLAQHKRSIESWRGCSSPIWLHLLNSDCFTRVQNKNKPSLYIKKRAHSWYKINSSSTLEHH